MLVGYARTSTIEQTAGLEAQLRDLTAQGCEKIFSEQVSSINAKRLELERAIEFVRDGDVLVVTRLDRLARSVGDLNQIVARLQEKQIGLKILDMAIDTTSPTGRLLMNLVGSIAQFEREIMLARQREGAAPSVPHHRDAPGGERCNRNRKSDGHQQVVRLSGHIGHYGQSADPDEVAGQSPALKAGLPKDGRSVWRRSSGKTTESS